MYKHFLIRIIGYIELKKEFMLPHPVIPGYQTPTVWTEQFPRKPNSGCLRRRNQIDNPDQTAELNRLALTSKCLPRKNIFMGKKKVTLKKKNVHISAGI